MMRSRSLAAALLGITVGLAGSLALVGCGSGSGNGHGERVSDVDRTRGAEPSTVAVAASKEGRVAALWGTGESLELKELPTGSWHWSKAETVTSAGESERKVRLGYAVRWSPPAADFALGYDSHERLLAAWVAPLGQGRFGQRWSIKARLRDHGKWGPERLVARLPEKLNDADLISGIRISSPVGRFVLSWSAAASGRNDDYSIHSSGLSILEGGRWTKPEEIGSLFPAQIQQAGSSALALWIDSGNSRLLYASLALDGKLGKPRVLAPSASFVTTSSTGDGIAAAWVQRSITWASIWNGKEWSRPERLARNGGDEPRSEPVAIAGSVERKAVAWVRPGELTKGASYAIEERGIWRKPRSLLTGAESSANSVSAGALASGEIVLVGAGWQQRLEITRISARGRTTASEISTPDGSSYGAFAASPRAVAFVWGAATGSEAHPETLLHAWVYRP